MSREDTAVAPEPPDRPRVVQAPPSIAGQPSLHAQFDSGWTVDTAESGGAVRSGANG